MLTCYIVDDETHAVNTLVSYVEKAPGLELVGFSTNPLEALGLINSTLNPDIVFVDVDMPELSGVDLAGQINDHTAVIFTTAFPEYAVEAFEQKAYDYLLKPISFPRFLDAVKKVQERLPVKDPHEVKDHIYVKSSAKGNVVRINFADIVYVESIKNYVIIYTSEEKMVTYLTMKELETTLSPDRFFRVHKSFIINADMIKTVNGATIRLRNNTVIPLGQIYKISLQNYINQRLLRSSRQL